MTFGSTWGDSEYVTPLDGQFAFSLRGEVAISMQRGSWGFGLYAEVADPGSHFESRWLGGGGLHLLSPRLWIFGGELSSGFYRRESETGAYNGFTSGLALGLRPRFCFWDFLVAVRVDLRHAFGRDEQSVTVSAQVDLAVLFLLGAMALKGSMFRL
jgi:hypothetical protein